MKLYFLGIFHDFYCHFGKTKIFVYRKPEGFGLVCHRAIKTVCEVLGIKDLYAKCEGSPNMQHVVKAFFLGLLNQKRYDQMAESKGLHLVEFRKEYGDFPKVVASPTKCRTEEDIRHDEIMDYTQVSYYHHNKFKPVLKMFCYFIYSLYIIYSFILAVRDGR